MTKKRGQQKLAEYLAEAHATELALTRTLQAHIAMTPGGAYRRGLERHLTETRNHAKRVDRRIKELGHGRSLVEIGTRLAQDVLAQMLAVSMAPLDLLRGDGGWDKVLRNARDECASEALEIAIYDAIEELARELDDQVTAELAASIRSDEERVLGELREAIPTLVSNVVRVEVEGKDTFDLSRTGAAQELKRTARAAAKTGRSAAREASAEVRETAQKAKAEVRESAREARKVPGVARAEGELEGTLASASDLAIPNYDDLSAEEIVARLPELAQIELAKIHAYERRHADRKTVLDRIESLQAEEPWPGYDELTVDEIREVLDEADDSVTRRVAAYERRHKQRRGALDAAERELSRR